MKAQELQVRNPEGCVVTDPLVFLAWLEHLIGAVRVDVPGPTFFTDFYDGQLSVMKLGRAVTVNGLVFDDDDRDEKELLSWINQNENPAQAS